MTNQCRLRGAAFYLGSRYWRLQAAVDEILKLTHLLRWIGPVMERKTSVLELGKVD